MSNGEIATSSSFGLYQNAGTTTIASSDLHHHGSSAFWHTGGALTVSSSTIRNQSGYYGLYSSPSGALTLTNNEFSNNSYGTAVLYPGTGMVSTHWATLRQAARAEGSPLRATSHRMRRGRAIYAVHHLRNRHGTFRQNSRDISRSGPEISTPPRQSSW